MKTILIIILTSFIVVIAVAILNRASYKENQSQNDKNFK